MPSSDLILLHAPSVFDFRSKSILYGPVSDLVPSTPVFEMYPIGFTTIAEYLERHGYDTRIVNLASRMLEDPDFDVEASLRRLDAPAFGIDLHWLPHAHGSIEVAGIVKRLHPARAIIFGGFSATYFHSELIRYAAVDFVVRGDSTEEPMLQLVGYLRSGGSAHPASGSPEARRLGEIPNLVWKDRDGAVQINPLSYVPEDLDHVLLDYTGVVRSVARYRDLASHKPFPNWMKYPITAALTVRGCRYNCVSCGGSACAFRTLHGRQKPAYRDPVQLASDIRRIGDFSQGPVFVLGDIRQAGETYAERFLEAVGGYPHPVFIELFDAAPRSFLDRVGRAFPNWTLEISMESHDDDVRQAFGRPYTREAIERTMEDALAAGCQRLDLFFMVGLKGQTYESVMGTIDYSREMLERYGRESIRRVVPFISPLAPFVDPGSRAFEDPSAHGYRLFARTLEEHRLRLLAPSWKYVLNYETRWMNRHQIVAATYEAGRRLNQIKGELGVIDAATAMATDARIGNAVRLIGEIDRIMAEPNATERHIRLKALKAQVDNSNLSTVCDKRELEIPVRGWRINLVQAARVAVRGWWRRQTRSRSDLRL
ncbi:MAG: B12-binding domain/radical SAM domain protein [Chloroflexi bacterium RBG_16_64_43]|nr:MAG: B12-binding domain/radical SAM domain protein [Chloroflexi bacterium RBG_16_64_43]